ncbi:MAG: hypothetical protein ACJ73E_00510 [Mycobacteriales bacterium]
MPGQLSFLTAGVRPPAVDDLEGLLLGVAQVVRLGGTARLSVLVEPSWRVQGVLTAYAERGLRGEAVPGEEGATSVRTPFSRTLLPVAQRWVRGAVKSVPPGFVLDGSRLRLWAVGAGRRDEHGYLLRLSPHDPAVWEPAGAALAGLGIAGTFVGSRAGGPAYRITGRRRSARLREYVGEAPAGAPRTDWPD